MSELYESLGVTLEEVSLGLMLGCKFDLKKRVGISIVSRPISAQGAHRPSWNCASSWQFKQFVRRENLANHLGRINAQLRILAMGTRIHNDSDLIIVTSCMVVIFFFFVPQWADSWWSKSCH